jgi:hypothetical protein
MIDRLVLVLMAGSAVFGALLLAELTSAPDQPVVMPSSPHAEAPAAPPPQRPPVEQLVQTSLAQPLFSPTRRPPDTAAVARAAEPELLNVRLTGIVLEPGRRLAIFAVPGSKPLSRGEGEEINDWRVESIGPSQVSLTGAAGTMVLEPKFDPALVRSQPIAGATPANPLFPVAAGAKPPQANPPTQQPPVPRPVAQQPAMPRAGTTQQPRVLFPGPRMPPPANNPAPRPNSPGPR